MEDSAYKIVLTQKERTFLHGITHNGQRSARIVLRVLILLSLDQGEHQDQPILSERDIASILHISTSSVTNTKRRFVKGGVNCVIEEKPVEPHIRFKEDFQEHLIALTSCPPPDGRRCWSLRLLADKMVELEHTEKISHETVRRLLKKANLSLNNDQNKERNSLSNWRYIDTRRGFRSQL